MKISCNRAASTKYLGQTLIPAWRSARMSRRGGVYRFSDQRRRDCRRSSSLRARDPARAAGVRRPRRRSEDYSLPVKPTLEALLRPSCGGSRGGLLLVRVRSVDVDGRSLCECLAEGTVCRGDGPGFADDSGSVPRVAGRANVAADIRGSLCVSVSATCRSTGLGRCSRSKWCPTRGSRLDWFPTELGQLGLARGGACCPIAPVVCLVGSPSCPRLYQRLSQVVRGRQTDAVRSWVCGAGSVIPDVAALAESRAARRRRVEVAQLRRAPVLE